MSDCDIDGGEAKAALKIKKDEKYLSRIWPAADTAVWPAAS